MKENSLLYWYPRIKNLSIRTPKTEIIELKIPHLELIKVVDGKSDLLNQYMNEIKIKAKIIGYPLFMRTDELSNKHDWKNSCYVEKEEDLISHIYNLIECSFIVDIMGIPIRAIILREYIPMKNLFKAFRGEMPVNPEIRFFIKDGKVLCWHWYWIEDAIIFPSDEFWKEKLNREKKLTEVSELEELNKYTKIIAKRFKGYWSVDFCKSKENQWILIDMALGHKSWHPDDCKHKIKGSYS